MSTPPSGLVFLTANISVLNGINFDHVYLSVTEIRTEYPQDDPDYFRGTADVYVTSTGAPRPPVFPLVVGSSEIFLAAVDATLAAGTMLVGSLTGTGVGGNRLLLDVTTAVQASLANNISQLGFLLEDQIDGNKVVGILGTNYDSGLPKCAEGIAPCQYFATSEYEYPTLMATIGDQVSPISELTPVRQVFPVGPNPPPELPEPGTIALLAIALSGLALSARRRQARPTAGSTFAVFPNSIR